MTDRQEGREDRARGRKGIAWSGQTEGRRAGRAEACRPWYLQHSWVHAWEHGHPLRVADRGPLHPGRLFIRFFPPGRLLFY